MRSQSLKSNLPHRELSGRRMNRICSDFGLAFVILMEMQYLILLPAIFIIICVIIREFSQNKIKELHNSSSERFNIFAMVRFFLKKFTIIDGERLITAILES